MIVLRLVVVSALAGVTAATLQNTGVDRVAWLRGCWENRSPRGTVEEQWMAPRGKTMLMMGRTIRGDSLVEYEQVVLRERGEQLIYEAHPSFQDTASFTSTLVSDTAVAFQNLQHDFPQRIEYHRRGADSLIAWVEGTRNGQTRRFPFPYARVRCAE